MLERHRRRRAATVATLAAALALAVPPTAGLGGYEDPGYDPGGGSGGGGGGGDEPGGGGAGGGAGGLQFELSAKKKQRSLKAVKVKATCENRPCTVDAKGKLRAGDERAKLKPDEETLAAGATDKLRLKLPKAAKREAKSAARDDEKITARVRGKARGVGGGGSAEDSVKVKLKP